MDIQINELQKIFGKTPINLNSRTITFLNKKTRNTLLVAGSLLLVGSVGYYFYKLGKKHSNPLTKTKPKELNDLERASISYETKNSNAFFASGNKVKISPKTEK